MSKVQSYTQYFCSNASNPRVTTTTVIDRNMLANYLRVARKSGRWHINRHDDGGYVMSSKSTGWVFTIDPNE